MKPRLVSFKLCPFVQRAVIVLREKNVEFDITYIDLEHPPEWFTRISPLGKVPVLQVGEEVLFESAVIMEYLDEVNPPSLHPHDPLKRAHNRAWFEVASSLFFNQYRLTTAKDEQEFSKHLHQIKDEVARVEAQIHGPWFNGPEFNLVDAAFAPFFMRNRLLDAWHPLGVLEGLPRLQAWETKLLERPSVMNSVIEDFPETFRAGIRKGAGYSANLFG